MLSGHPDSKRAQAHAEELLELGGRRRGRWPALWARAVHHRCRRARLVCEGAPPKCRRLTRRSEVDRTPVTKFIFVTGGVSSSLGKGLTASSLGRLLKLRGVPVTMAKLDPYINVDPGTMNPGEHGEVFVTEDGGETDLDLGHYERFIDVNLKSQLERHDRLDLLLGDRQGAPRRLPGQDRPGHPARHRRDQRARPPPRRRGRRRRHRRDRWHGRRHRDRPVPRGDPSVPLRRRPPERVLPAPHPGAVPGAVGGAEDEAHPALGHRAAQPGHPARRDRVPERPPDLRRPEAEDLAPLRRPGRGRHLGGRRVQHLRDPARPPRGGTRRVRVRDARHRPRRAPDRPLRVGVGGDPGGDGRPAG